VDAAGVETTYEHDDNGNITRTIRHGEDEDHVTDHVFDENDRVVQTVSADGGMSETEYDAFGRVSKQREFFGPGVDDFRETETFYDDYGRIRYVKYPDDTYEEHEHDVNGNEIMSRSRTRFTAWNYPDPPDLDPCSLPTDPDCDVSIVTRHAYDAMDRRVKTCVEESITLIDDPGWDLGCTFTFYDEAGRARWSRDARGAVSVTVYDDANRPIERCGPFDPGALDLDEDTDCSELPEGVGVTTTHYDAAGRVEWTQDPVGIYSVPLYDDAGRRTAECRTDSLPLTADPDPPVSDANVTCKTWEHDALGRAVVEEDRNGIRTRFGFDEVGRLASVTDALDQVTSYGHDDHGNMVTQTDALERVTHYAFDASGRRTSRTLPMQQRERFFYGIDGMLQSRIDFMSRTTTHLDVGHDGHVEEVDFTNDPSVATSYWGDGQRRTVTDARETVTYQRNLDRGWLERVDHSDGTSIDYRHDEAGNIIARITDPPSPLTDGRAVLYSYDAAGRIDTIKDGFNPDSPSSCMSSPCFIVEYDYDPAGRLDLVTYENAGGTPQILGDYVYDDVAGGLDSITWTTAGGSPVTLLAIEYDLDEAGRRVGATETWESGRVRTVAWEFDELYRLIDEESEYTVGDGDDFHLHYTYDAVGNRLLEERWLNGTPQADVVSTYDANDRIWTAGAMTFDWDENGNMTRDGDNTYTWDDRDRLHDATFDGGTLGFEYDVDGLKQQETLVDVGGTHIRNFVVDGTWPHAQVLEERDGDGELLSRLLRGGQLCLQHRTDESPSDHWYLHDALGSTRGLVDAADLDESSDEWDYEAFGVEHRASANATNSWRFAGEERQSRLGLDALRARWLKPSLGGFLARDGHEGRERSPLSRNGYPYATQDPIACIDPSGRIVEAAVVGALYAAQHARLRAHEGAPEHAPLGVGGPNITQAIVDHLNDVATHAQGGIPPVALLAAPEMSYVARHNGFEGVFGRAMSSDELDTLGTATLGDLVISRQHIDHMLIMAYLSLSYGSYDAWSFGDFHEKLNLTPGDGERADLAFNKVALRIAAKMHVAGPQGGVPDLLTVAEVQEVTTAVAADERMTMGLELSVPIGFTNWAGPPQTPIRRYEWFLPRVGMLPTPGDLELPGPDWYR